MSWKVLAINTSAARRLLNVNGILAICISCRINQLVISISIISIVHVFRTFTLCVLQVVHCKNLNEERLQISRMVYGYYNCLQYLIYN